VFRPGSSSSGTLQPESVSQLEIFTFYTKAVKPVKAVIMQFTSTISAEDITAAFQLNYDINKKQTTALHNMSMILKAGVYRSQNGLKNIMYKYNMFINFRKEYGND
jgi:hypothetical protein